MLDEIGLLDESLFMYYEDLELCLRAHEADWSVSFVPDAIAFHRQRSSPRSAYFDEYVDHRNRLMIALRSLPARRLPEFLSREMVFQLRSLAALFAARSFDRLRYRTAGLLATVARLPAIAWARFSRHRKSLGDSATWIALLQPDWGYPKVSLPTSAIGPATPAPGRLDFSPSGTASFGLGWWPPEHDGDCGWMRWMGCYSCAQLQVPGGATVLRIRARSLLDQRVSFRLGDELLGEVDLSVSDWREMELPISARTGQTARLFVEAERSIRPRELGVSADDRRLGVAWARIEFR